MAVLTRRRPAALLAWAIALALALSTLGPAGRTTAADPGPASSTLAPTLPLAGLATASSASSPHPVVRENRRPGTPRWKIPWTGHQLANDTNKAIKGYASATSVNVGQRIDIKVSAAARGAATWNLYRLGWYAGNGSRLVASGSFTAAPQPACPVSSTTGEIVCSWSTAVSLDVPTSWVSGEYAMVLTKDGYQNYVVFTVRDDARPADVLLVQPVNTYQAYNNYPNDGTGKSLYGYNSSGAVTVGGTTAAVKVSFDRPYAGHGAGHLFKEDVHSTRYLEARGYDVKYATSVDLHRDPALASSVRAVVFAGHQEYWTAEQFSAAEAARNAGTSLAFLGANSVYWQVRYEKGERTLVCYKSATADPVTDPAAETVRFRDALRPEQPLLGVMWPPSRGMLGPESPWVVTNPGHWFYRGTGVSEGTQIPRLVGVEADRRVAEYPGPVGTGWEAVARSPYTVRNATTTGIHEATLYQAPSGAHVFGAGSITYGYGIGDIGRTDARAQTMTGNVLTRMAGGALSVTTDRYAGETRYDTAASASAATFPAGFGGTVYLATGGDWPDALGAGAATQGEGPVLLVTRTGLPKVTLDELVRLAPSRVVLTGGSDVVTDDVADDVLAATGVRPVRVAGDDRYRTAAAVSADRFPAGVPVAYVATGLAFPDALAAGAAGAQTGGPVLLSKRDSVPAATIAELTRLRPARIVVAGGTSVVSDTAVAQLRTVAPVVRRAGANRYETALDLMRDTHGQGEGGMVAIAAGSGFADALAAGPVVAARGGSLVLARPDGSVGVSGAEEIVRTDPSLLVGIGGLLVLPQATLEAAAALFDVADGEPTASALRRQAGPEILPPDPAGEPEQIGDEPTREELREAYEERNRLPWMDE